MRWRQYKIARERMVREHVYGRGIRDPRVIEAMLRVPRHLFIGRDAGIEAYADHSYPIGFRQTMSQPYMVAYLCEQLRLDGDERVLEIGTGSGYHAAVLANLCRDVCTIERVPELADRARGLLRDLLITNTEIHTFSGDAFQVDPGRSAPGWTRVTIDRSTLWLAPLPAAENGFAAGIVPGENAVDTKASSRLTRTNITIRDTIARGFGKPELRVPRPEAADPQAVKAFCESLRDAFPPTSPRAA